MENWENYMDGQNLLNISVVWHHFYGVTSVAGETDFQIKARVVTAENKIGNFDILPGHANLISVIFNNIILYTIEKKTDVYLFEKGIVEVSGNEVRFFLKGKSE
ncbi:MAG: hypothetical protein UU34_C0019G0004 [Candidatus Curtissbacteria bacterium GW2011_GWA1_41_11]|uniref:ATP synthase F1 complex delta/epsilon subunit N-terminal domain-containing protein n=1 Tax=Candidatus Curtissbacteria bacterium GW2011_GWA1_41_11 TaxID=1618409 RepID=A0A0G0UFK2_9BACT|nr:MAG: hypothetical protein UU34_C0019G0004 [Candidatus Curtissbacteria bacterium GW2011_GWA1_41_11]